jgi:hypothetical protein
MAAVHVSDANTRSPITNASFDRPFSGGTGGFYDVQLNLAAMDFIFTTFAPGYNSETGSYAFNSGIVALTPAGQDSGDDGGSCF